VVVSDSSGEISVSCTAPLGRFIRIGKGNIAEVGDWQNISVTSVDLESVAKTKPNIISTSVHDHPLLDSIFTDSFLDRLMIEVQSLILMGALKAYPTTVFGVGDLRKALVELRDPALATPVIKLESQDAKELVPVRIIPNYEKRTYTNRYLSFAVRMPMFRSIRTRRT